jgi:hypothetical protein
MRPEQADWEFNCCSTLFRGHKDEPNLIDDKRDQCFAPAHRPGKRPP